MAQPAPATPVSDLRADCPEPPQYNFLGFGLYLFGERDPDEETGSFVRTLYLCLMYLPVLALRSYRVEPTDDGWRYLERVPVSRTARVFSLIATLGILGGLGYVSADAYWNSPEGIASRKLAEADRLATAGHVGEAARLLAEVARGPSLQARTSSKRLATLLDEPSSRADPEGRGVAFREAVAVQKAGRWPGSAESLHESGVTLARDTAPSDPRGAWAILDAIAPLASRGQEAESESALRHELLEKVVAAEPSNVEWASRLAVDYESRNQMDRAEKVLSPLREKLGDLEGARILGLADARANRFDQALPLLRAYTKDRLERLGQAEARLRSLYRGIEERVVGQLKGQRVFDFNYDGYHRADMNGKQTILNEYLDMKIKGDPEVTRAREALVAESPVVPVALELGMLLLQRAQMQADPSARKSMLEEAEATFLAISRMVGERAEVQLSLAQVYYWQGKHEEGRKLFDEVLRARNRDPAVLLEVADMLRNLGSHSEARVLAEEGYNKATVPQVKNGCATIRGMLGEKIEDKILWLRRANPDDPFTKAILSSMLATQAIQQGNEEQAIGHLRQTVALYDAMPESPAALNNGSNALRMLANLTGDTAAIDRSVSMIEKAAALEPGNSLTLSTASEALLEAGLREIIGRAIDLKLIKSSANVHLLAYLARDESDRLASRARLRSNPVVNRALSLMEKVILLAPRNPDSYESLMRVLAYLEDAERLRRVGSRLDSVELDLGDQVKKARETYAGQDVEEMTGLTKAALLRVEPILPVARAKGGPTFALAASQVLAARMAAANYGLEVDRDPMVKLAEETFAAAPSLSSRWYLIETLLFRAAERLARADAGFARLRDRFARVESTGSLVASALSEDGPLKDLALKDADVIRAIDLVRESYAASPGYTSGARSWSLLNARYPEVARALANSYLTNESKRLEDEMVAKLKPYDSTVALNTYWAARMQNKDLEGLKILAEARERGVPISIGAP
jgi:tetratricopeptide (TPR) repeat protein